MTSIELAWLIRRHGIEMTHLSGGSHIGAILSAADIIAVLYADILRFDPGNPKCIHERRYVLFLPAGGRSSLLHHQCQRMSVGSYSECGR